MSRSRRPQLLSDPSQLNGSVAGVQRIRHTHEEDSRLSSCPDEAQVNRRRQEERNQGGPSVPHNSMDNSLIDLSETAEIGYEGEVFGGGQSNFINIVLSNMQTMTMALSQDDEETEIMYEVETVSETIVIESDDNSDIDEDEDVTRPLTDHDDSGDILTENVDATIDLTDSPIRQSKNDNGPRRQDEMEMTSHYLDTTSNFDGEAMRSFCASLKCPICYDSYLVLHRKGVQLCSTICGHVLCNNCALACIGVGKDECPTCRRRLPRNPPYNYHPLFIF